MATPRNSDQAKGNGRVIKIITQIPRLLCWTVFWIVLIRYYGSVYNNTDQSAFELILVLTSTLGFLAYRFLWKTKSRSYLGLARRIVVFLFLSLYFSSWIEGLYSSDLENSPQEILGHISINFLAVIFWSVLARFLANATWVQSNREVSKSGTSGILRKIRKEISFGIVALLPMFLVFIAASRNAGAGFFIPIFAVLISGWVVTEDYNDLVGQQRTQQPARNGSRQGRGDTRRFNSYPAPPNNGPLPIRPVVADTTGRGGVGHDNPTTRNPVPTVVGEAAAPPQLTDNGELLDVVEVTATTGASGNSVGSPPPVPVIAAENTYQEDSGELTVKKAIRRRRIPGRMGRR